MIQAETFASAYTQETVPTFFQVSVAASCAASLPFAKTVAAAAAADAAVRTARR